MTPQEQQLIGEINAMSHEQLCRTWRFAPFGHPIVQGEVGDRLQERLFREMGGFTPEISKRIGW